MSDIDNTTNNTVHTKKYISVKQAGEIISVHPRTVTRLMKSKGIPHIMVNNKPRIIEDFTKYLGGKE